jgi:D-amino-acid dehydrogenase
VANDRKTIAIIGAGIVGVSTAIWLQRAGHDVILIDRAGPAEGTSFGNGGVLASCAVVPVTVPGLFWKTPKMLLLPNQPLFLKWGYLPRLMPWLLRYLSHATASEARRIAAALMPILGDSVNDHLALAAGTGAEKWVVPSDYLYLYDDRAGFLDDAFGWGLRRDHGFTWAEMDGDALRAYDPCLANGSEFAVRMGNHGRITDPGQYVRDLAAHVVTQGGRLLLAEVEDIVRDGGRVTGVRAGGETVACDAAVIATGVWSAPLAKRLGLNVPLESERGYHIEVWEPSVMPSVPSMLASAKIVMTPMEGRLRLAGMVEFGGLTAPPSRAPFDLLRRNLKRVLPGLRYADITEWMGHRPATTDSIPVIGAVPGLTGAYVGYGHQHVGLTGGPMTGRLLAQLISGQKPNVDLTPYSPARFA